MKKKIHYLTKTIKIVLFTILGLTLLIFGGIAFAINFVFTPESITPVIVKEVNNNINGEVDIRSVELTFFSTFPNFTLLVEDGVVKGDSSYVARNELKTDTLLSFKRAEVRVNPMAYINNKQVEIGHVELSSARVYAFVSKSGEANWMLAKIGENDKPEETVENEIEPTEDAEIEIKGIELSNIIIKDGAVVYDDRASGLYARFYDFNTHIKGNLSDSVSSIHYTMSFDKSLFYMDNQLYFSKVALSVEADLEHNKEKELLKVNNADVKINSTELNLNGDVYKDRVELNTKFKVNSIAELMALVPEGIIENSAKIKTDGVVDISANISGGYRNGEIPIVKLGVFMNDVSLYYEGYEHGIDKLNVDISAYADLNSKKNQVDVDINKFILKGGFANIDIKGNLSNVMKAPIYDFKVKSDVDMTTLAKSIPFNPNIKMGGEAKININGLVKQSQIDSGDYASINATGAVELNKLFLIDKEKNFNLSVSKSGVKIENNSAGLLKLIGGLGDVECSLRGDDAKLQLDSVVVNLEGKQNKKESYLDGSISYKNLNASLRHDSLKLMSGYCVVETHLANQSSLKFVTDSLSVKLLNTYMNMKKAGIKLEIQKDSLMSLKGTAGMGGIEIRSAMFPLPISMDATVMGIDGDCFNLYKAGVKIGDSNLVLTGDVCNILAANNNNDSLKITANLDAKSDNIDMLQLIKAMNYMNRQLENHKSKHSANNPKKELSQQEIATMQNNAAKEIAQDTTIEIYPIPNNLDFTFTTDFKKVSLGHAVIEDVSGKITVNNGEAHLRGLAMTALGAKMKTVASYKAHNTESADATFELDVKDINIKQIYESLPAFDSLMPMLRSFEGEVNLNFTADAKLKKAYEVDIKTLKSTLVIDGKNLVLLDGETFAEISKMLMFKNKKRNMVNSLDVHLTINDGAIEIYPFMTTIDRYKVAVGGKHGLDNSLDYHVSVLKSPIPIKFGVNVTGNIDDMKIRVGKTKYKYMGEPNYKVQLNPNFLEVRKEIIDKIRDL